MTGPRSSTTSVYSNGLKYGVSVVGAMLGLCLVVLGYLNTTGFCYRDMRYLTDKELILMAADAAVRANKAYAAIETRIEYESAAELIAKNPNCCSVTRDQSDPHLQEVTPNRLFGAYALLVEVRYRAKQDGPRPFYSDVFYLSACGERLDNVGSAQADDNPATLGR